MITMREAYGHEPPINNVSFFFISTRFDESDEMSFLIKCNSLSCVRFLHDVVSSSPSIKRSQTFSSA